MATSKCKGGWETESIYWWASFCYSDQEVRQCAEWGVTLDHQQFGAGEVQGEGAGDKIRQEVGTRPQAVQFSSVSQSCLTFCDPMNHSMPSLPVHHQLPEFTQTHVHWVGDAIQPFCLQSFPASGSFLMSQFYTSGGQRIGASASSSVPPMNIRGWSPLGLTGLISLQSKGLQETLGWWDVKLLVRYLMLTSHLWSLDVHPNPLQFFLWKKTWTL